MNKLYLLYKYLTSQQLGITVNRHESDMQENLYA